VPALSDSPGSSTGSTGVEVSVHLQGAAGPGLCLSSTAEVEEAVTSRRGGLTRTAGASAGEGGDPSRLEFQNGLFDCNWWL